MIPPNRKRISAWKVVGVIAGVLVLLVGAMALWIRSVADRRWTEMEREARSQLGQARARDSSRPALRGEAVPGNAWDDYAPAVKVRLSSSVLGEFVARGPKADRTAVEAILAANPTLLDALRKGARRTHGQYPIDWEKDGGALPGLGNLQGLAQLAVCQARLLAEAGRSREAAELLLDTCQFARDVGHNGLLISDMIALAIYTIALTELHDLIRSGTLTSEELTQVGRELELVDRHFPDIGIGMLNESIFMAFNTIRAVQTGGEGMGEGAAMTAMAWKFGFSTRLMMADTFDEVRRMNRRIHDLRTRSWAEAQADLQRLSDELRNDRNPMVRLYAGVPSGGLKAEREVRAKIRLLRMAAHYRATGEVLELEDPLGAKMRTVKTGGTLQIWSVGSNGVDDGGAGTFKPQAGKAQSDIVLEVER